MRITKEIKLKRVQTEADVIREAIRHNTNFIYWEENKGGGFNVHINKLQDKRTAKKGGETKSRKRKRKKWTETLFS